MKRILFIQDSGLSFVNRQVAILLEEQFGEGTVDIYNIKISLRQRRRFFLANLLFFVWEYRLDLLLGRKNLAALKSTLFVTSYAYRLVKKTVARQAAVRDYLFTFQTQSQYYRRMFSAY